MSEMTNFWTFDLKYRFHQAVRELHCLNNFPAEEKDYRDSHPLHSEAYTLTLHDERELADDIAFLAHVRDNAKDVSAVTILEMLDGITFLVASNQTPSDFTITELRKILTIVSNYCTTRRHRYEFSDQIFDVIVTLCETRILQRIQPISPCGARRQSLLSRLEALLNLLKPEYNVSPELLEKVRELAKQLRNLEKGISIQNIHESIKRIISTCVDISTFGGQGSLENYLQSLGLPWDMMIRGEIQRIDKLSRYFHVSTNLIRIARKENYISIFRNISLESIPSFPKSNPPGSSAQCFVHAEMQQVLHQERFPHNPPPRVIGCSKSACYLCDMFIQRQARYYISIAHRRLYHMWTLPDVDWMNTEQAGRFANIISAMTQILRNTSKYQRHHAKPPRRTGTESRARLPLPGISTPSEVSCVSEQASRLSLSTFSRHSSEGNSSNCEDTREIKPAGNSHTERASTPSNTLALNSADSTLSIEFDCEDLPFFREIHSGLSSLEIEVSSVRLCFDFTSVSAGYLRISRSAALEGPSPTVDVASLQSTQELKIGCTEDRSSTRFQLVHGLNPPVDVEFFWRVSG